MKIHWYGHACFQIETTDGTRLVTDPYTPETSGYLPVTEAADRVVVSSDNDSFHCRADLIPGNPHVVNALELARGTGELHEDAVTIRAIEAMEALNHRFHDPDQNAMYRIEADGLVIGHMGDMGNALSPAQMAFFEGTDVLLALVGGHPTIELDDLMRLIEFVRPSIVIPMHFRTLRYRPRNSFWIETFLSRFDEAQIDFPCSWEVSVDAGTLPPSTRIVVLTHSN